MSALVGQAGQARARRTAAEMATIRQALMDAAIRSHVDETAWATEERRELRERTQLKRLAAEWPRKQFEVTGSAARQP